MHTSLMGLRQRYLTAVVHLHKLINLFSRQSSSGLEEAL